MENNPYLISARKYRPTKFEEMVGQKAITETLTRSIREGRIAQSFLFSGPKGVGKTSCARIFARMINENYLKEVDELSFNVFELDAASNNSVEDIRSLIEQIRFSPQKGRYKVYIIDEVHMLSQAAFNAFLKTLEEPPSYVVFILATTEKHKVLPTIISRCQLHEFKRISSKDIQAYLKKISLQEKIKAENEALFLIANQSDGSLRDALSFLDRLIPPLGENLTTQMVEEQLGVLAKEHYIELTEHIVKNDISGVLIAFDKVLQKGFDMEIFLMGLASHFRDLLVVRDEKTLNLLEASETTQKKYLLQSSKTSINFLIKGLEICKNAEMHFKSSKHPRLTVEITLIELSSLTKEKESLENTPLADKAPPLLQEKSLQADPTSQSSEQIHSAQLVKIQINSGNKLTVQASEKVSTEKKENSSSKNSCLVETKYAKVVEKKSANPVSFSILEALNEATHPPLNHTTDKLPEDPFSKEIFRKAWNDFIKTLKLKNGSALYTILKNISWEMMPDHKITLYFSSRAAMDEFLHVQGTALAYLKEALSNFALKFEYLLKESNEKKNIYTPEEKYRFLSKKNPFLTELIKRLSLDFF